MCNTDLSETELEINVIKGIGYHVANPKDVDTYVKVEFPYPQVKFHSHSIRTNLTKINDLKIFPTGRALSNENPGNT